MDAVTTLAGIKTFFGLPDDLPPPYPYAIKNQTRAVLGPLTHALGFTEGAELGCWKGVNAATICEGNPTMHLICVDIWEAYAGYTDHRVADHFRQAEIEAIHRLSPYTVSIIKDWTTEAAKTIPDKSLDFLYIDANHSFESVCLDLFAWVPKVKSGGIISGHDYYTPARKWNFRVVEAVHAYTAAHDIAPWFVLGRKKVLHGEQTERERSYFWVNP